MSNLQNLPIGIQDFEKIRKGDYLYVDKTASVYQLVSTGCYYFLSRPRRFGKSLLLSTLHAYFDGKKELFDGLEISKYESEWEQYPILHLDLNAEKYETESSLDAVLGNALLLWEKLYDSSPSEVTLSLRFQGIIRRAYEHTGKQVVILVDEYDKPMLQAIGDEKLQDDYRNTLKAFYGALKSMDRYIKFAFLTGVTKFGKVSVFSDLNHLNDISMDESYHDICGINEKELTQYFSTHISHLAEKQSMTVEETQISLRQLYDGYHFCENIIEGIYNPFSLLNTFQKNKFGSYWFETGTPTYLVELLKQHNSNLAYVAQVQTSEAVLNSIDIMSTDPVPVIFQSGYLTIKGYDSRFKMYQLGFPNKEVEEGFLNFLLPYYTKYSKIESPFQIQQFVKDVETGDTESFLKRLQSFFADTPYELVKDLENHYQNVLFIISKLAGFYVKAEYHTSDGRIDMLLQTPDYTYVMEFKLNGTAKEALEQINAKQYALPFTADTRKLIKIGLNFSNEIRNIERWVIEE